MPYVYLIKCNEFYKIGVATDVQTRLAALQTGNPFRIDVVISYEFPTANAVEAALHQKFKAKQKNLEWFNLTEKDIAEFRQVCALLGGIEHSENVTLTQRDTDEAETLGVISNRLPPKEMIETIEKLLSIGYRLEVGGSGKYKGQYLIARRGSGTDREWIQLGKVTDEIKPYLKSRPGKGNRTLRRRK
jgi:predicted GIY-YIG superfamily endonuclease